MVHVPFSPTVRVFFADRTEKRWHACGSSAAYQQARKTLPVIEFEQFVRMEAAFVVMDSGSPGRQTYPCVARMHPKGYVDYLSEAVVGHMSQARSLLEACAAKAKVFSGTVPGLGDDPTGEQDNQPRP